MKKKFKWIRIFTLSLCATVMCMCLCVCVSVSVGLKLAIFSTDCNNTSLWSQCDKNNRILTCCWPFENGILFKVCQFKDHIWKSLLNSYLLHYHKIHGPRKTIAGQEGMTVDLPKSMPYEISHWVVIKETLAIINEYCFLLCGKSKSPPSLQV